MTDNREFPNRASSVTLARQFVVEKLAGLPPSVVEPVALMVSEISTNCIRHAHTGFVVAIELDDDEIQVTIGDRGAGMPALRAPDPAELSGRGLGIVELLADSWGVTPSTTDEGKIVWFKRAVRDDSHR